MTTPVKTDWAKPVLQWTHGPWSLNGFVKRDAHGTARGISVTAVKYTKQDGTRHGSYSYTVEHGLLTVSMADVKVNAHMRTAKVAAMLKGAVDAANQE